MKITPNIFTSHTGYTCTFIYEQGVYVDNIFVHDTDIDFASVTPGSTTEFVVQAKLTYDGTDVAETGDDQKLRINI